MVYPIVVMVDKYDSNLKRLMLQMNSAFKDCSRSVDPFVIERLAEVVFQVMSARYRIFHTMEHIFSTAEGLKTMGGIPTFAALFHDIVYYQVDKRIHPLLMPYQTEFLINEKTNECALPDLKSDRWLTIAGNIFAFKSGQVLNPMNGLNEFLSAVAAARMLSPTLTEWQVVQVIACIEATIPFRAQSEAGDSFRELHLNLKRVNQEYQLKASESEIDQTVKMCIALANQDICSFYSKDFGEFISGTWNLILENNPIFKNPLYTVLEYRKALQKVRGFFSFLKSDNVVHEWGNSPLHQECLAMKQQVSVNLGHALQYIDLKLVEMAILEVIANSTGGDAPYFLLIGESCNDSRKAPIERFFPSNPSPQNKNGRNETVYQVLKQGRKAQTSFDFNHSPIAAYLYENLTADEVTKAISLTQQFHDSKIDGKQFLSSFRSEIINPIVKGVSEISWSRKPKA